MANAQTRRAGRQPAHDPETGEVLPPGTEPNTALAVNPVNIDAALVGKTLFGGFKIKETKAVTRPVLSQVTPDGRPRLFVVKIIGPITTAPEMVGEKVADGANDGTIKKAPDIAPVINLETGEEQTLICNAALKSGLEREYPDSGYVGRSFGMASRLKPHKGGLKQLREYIIKELITE